MPDAQKTPVELWLAEIDSAMQREKNFRKDGQRITELFEGEKKAEFQFNILYSNTETLAPALYNSTPRPAVSERFKSNTQDVVAPLAARAAQRLLEFLLDDGMASYATFDELMKAATLEALVPGRGVTWFKYDPKIVQKPKAEVSEESVEAATGAQEPASYEDVEGEIVCGEEVPWDRFLHGYAKKWKDVPWVARLHFFDKDELTAEFGAALAAKVTFSVQEDNNSDVAEKEASKASSTRKTVPVYEIWDKASKKVYFVTPNYKDAFLREIDDPLQLSGFFPCPRPMAFMSKITTLTPVALYVMYEEQAKELNKVTVRINKLISALKVRGMYDGTVEGIASVLAADDNVLIPADNVAALIAQGNALEKAIWFFPIEKLVPVLAQLYLQRNQVKQTIYEITGIADIMRGSSQASETLGAQEIKNQWGTLRLKKAQKEVARYARDCLRIMAEIGVTKLSEDTLKKMTGLNFPTTAEKQQAQALVQQAQAAGQQVPPQIQQAATVPGWGDILALLKDDIQRAYRIDIETNSTVDAEATEDKQDISELLNAMAQFMNGMGPMIESGVLPFDAAKGMLLAIVKRYRFGGELEDAIKGMQPPKPPADPNQAKMEMEKQMMQLEIADKQRQSQADAEQAARDAAYKQQEHIMNMQELERKQELAIAQHNMKMQQARAKSAPSMKS